MEQRQYQKLVAWKEAHGLCLAIYKITVLFPRDERFGLISQMRRSAYSVPMNLAEGNAKRSQKERTRFIEIAAGSLEELHYQCVLSQELGYIDQKVFQECDDRIKRTGFLLHKLRSSLL